MSRWFIPDLAEKAAYSLALDWPEYKGKQQLDRVTIESNVLRKSLITNCDVTDLILYDSEIRDSYIVNSNLQGCILVSCLVEDSYIEESYVEGKSKLSKVSLKFCSVVTPWARDCKFYGCGITNSQILRSELQRSTIWRCKGLRLFIQTSEILGCSATLALVRDCHVGYSNLTDSEIQDGKLAKNITEDCNITTTVLALRKFPAEIRMLVFKHAISSKLLIALRGDPILYHEAIDVFRKRFPYVIRPSTADYEATIPPSLIAKIDKIIIRYSDFGSGPRLQLQTLSCKVLPQAFKNSTSIVSVFMDFVGTKFESGRFIEVAKTWTALGTVQQFSVRFAPRRQAYLSEMSAARGGRTLEDVWHKLDSLNILKMGNQCFKVNAKRVYDGGVVGDDKWLWEAKEGQVLTWSSILT